MKGRHFYFRQSLVDMIKKSRITAKTISLHIRCTCLQHSTRHWMCLLFAWKTQKLQARLYTTEVVLTLKLKYLFTNPGINFELQQIWNLDHFCNISVIKLMISGLLLKLH